VRLTAVWDRAGSAGRNLRPVLSDKEGYQMASVALVAEILPDLEDDEAGSEAAQ